MGVSAKMNKDEALRAILYEAAVLGAALRSLRYSPPNNDIGRDTDQLAVEAALIKFRSLFALLTNQGTKKDDMKIEHLGLSVDFGSDKSNMQALCKSINKYSVHLTTKRAKEDWPGFFLPRPPQFEDYCWKVLRETWQIVEKLLNDGCQLNGYAKKYFDHLQATMANDPNGSL
jgi:hypothetical protein